MCRDIYKQIFYYQHFKQLIFKNLSNFNMTNILSTEQLRLWVIPILMGLIWIGSFLVSFFAEFQDISLLFRLFCTFNLILLFELLLMYWDICLSLENFDLHIDHSFKMQCRTVPFMILALPFGVMSIIGGWPLVIYITTLFCAKTGMHHSVAYIDK